VGEEVGDARLFQETVDEGEVGLVVLRPVLVLEVLRGEPQLGLDLPLRQHLADDGGDGQVLKDAVVAPQGGPPQRGHDLQRVGREALLTGTRGLCLHQLHLAADARPDAGGGGQVGDAALESEARTLADDALEIDVVERRASDDGHLEEARHLLVNGEVADRQRVFFRSEGELEDRHRGRG
jgi:hypothetical protein